MNKIFGVIGGDRRQAELAQLLAGDGHAVRTYGLDRWKGIGPDTLDRAAAADVVIDNSVALEETAELIWRDFCENSGD